MKCKMKMKRPFKQPLRYAVRLRYYDSAVATRITLYDAAGTIVGNVTPVEAPDDAAFPYPAEITIVDPTLWNAEQPYLYTIVLDTPCETITDRVGCLLYTSPAHQHQLVYTQFQTVRRYFPGPVHPLLAYGQRPKPVGADALQHQGNFRNRRV